MEKLNTQEQSQLERIFPDLIVHFLDVEGN